MEQHSHSKRVNIDLEEAYDIIEKSNLVIFKWTLSQDIPTDFVSDNISIFGYKPEDFYNGPLADYWQFVHEDDRERVKRELYSARMNETRSYKNQYRVVCSDGNVRWVEEWVIHEYTPEGVLSHEKGILRDITDAHEIAIKLMESESRYKELFDNASALIFTFNSNGNLTSCNKTFKETFVIDENSQVLQLDDLFSETTLSRFRRQSFFEACLDNIDDRLELEMKNLKGELLFIEMRNRVIFNSGEMVEIQSVANDITDKKRAEETVKFLMEHDAMTGLYNRVYFDRKLDEYAKAGHKNLAIIIGDVNGLKMINDAFGHKSGDALLQEISKVFLSVFDEETDIIARLSGDEFAILTLKKNIDILIDRVNVKCKEQRVFPFPMDISLGYAIQKNKSQSIDSLFREADHQMYRKKLRESKRIKSMMIQSLQNQLSETSLETFEHCHRMKNTAEQIGVMLNLSEALMEELELTILMHDIGMVSISSEILEKTEPLTDEDRKAIRKHSEIGYHLLISSPNLAGVGEYVLSHHENYDGTGYPQGLKGMEIPLVSRIVAVADGYDAMTTDRPYRTAISHNEAIKDILGQSGKKYDPSVVHAFIKYYETENEKIKEERLNEK
ncbi:MAG: diguanylate cyclase [Clostridiales bacterium]|nr:diguanylate cyclase [Clostridiales bacterium]